MSEGPGAKKPSGRSRSIQKLIFWMIVVLMTLIVIAFFGIGAVAAGQLTKPKIVFNPDLNPGTLGLEYEEFQYPAREDGLKIAAWYIPSEQNQRAIILVHGRDDSKSHGFCDQFVSFAKKLHDAGFSVLLIDLRGHGQSAAARYTFGIKERWDVLGAVDWLAARGYPRGKIGVLGYSLGAASVIGAAAQEESIGAIWIDSAYADINSVLQRNWNSESGLPQVFLLSTQWMARLLYNNNFTASRPVDEIGRIAPRPIFMAHCQEDAMIPISHMEQLMAAAKNTQTWVIQVCDQHTLGRTLVPEKYNNHAIGYCIQPEVYEQKAIQFFEENLK